VVLTAQEKRLVSQLGGIPLCLWGENSGYKIPFCALIDDLIASFPGIATSVNLNPDEPMHLT